MKKVLFVMMAAAMMVSCGNKTQQTAHNDAAAFAEALKTAYPELPGDADALAQALYKK